MRMFYARLATWSWPTWLFYERAYPDGDLWQLTRFGAAWRTFWWRRARMATARYVQKTRP